MGALVLMTGTQKTLFFKKNVKGKTMFFISESPFLELNAK
jgi:hypothetical protein